MAAGRDDDPILRPARPRRARRPAGGEQAPQTTTAPHLDEVRELLEAAIDHLVALEEKVDGLSAQVAALSQPPSAAPAGAPATRTPRRRRDGGSSAGT